MVMPACSSTCRVSGRMRRIWSREAVDGRMLRRPGGTPARSASRPIAIADSGVCAAGLSRSEEHTSELQTLMRISYAVLCLKTKTQNKKIQVKYCSEKETLKNKDNQINHVNVNKK